MSKTFAIALKDIRATFTDRNLILIMLVTPLVLSTIIAVALGDVSSGSTFSDIPVAIVNLDEGDATGLNYGDIYVSTFIEATTDNTGLPVCEAAESQSDDTDNATFTLYDLTEATLLDDPEVARQGVEDGDYVAAVIIPADFSQRLAYEPGSAASEPVSVEVFGDAARSISAGIIASIIEGITNQISTGQITIASTIDTLIANGRVPQVDENTFSCAFVPAFNNVNVVGENIEGNEFNPLVVIGSAQAAFFALFTASGASTSILTERREWTLQRLLISPTSRMNILLGKLIGVFFTVLLQLIFLVVSFTIVDSLLKGELHSIWGNNVFLIAVLVFATALSAAGVGMVSAATARTVETSNIIGSIVAMLMGIFGGAFFPVGALGDFDFITRISIVRWGAEGFTKLSDGQTDIWVNVAFLLLIGLVLFGLSLMLFNRRQDV